MSRVRSARCAWKSIRVSPSPRYGCGTSCFAARWATMRSRRASGTLWISWNRKALNDLEASPSSRFGFVGHTTPRHGRRCQGYQKGQRWRAEGLLGLLPGGDQLRPVDQPRELFADHPQLVFCAGFVEPVDHCDQRAYMLLGQLKESLRCLSWSQTTSGKTATVAHDQAQPHMSHRIDSYCESSGCVASAI